MHTDLTFLTTAEPVWCSRRGLVFETPGITSRTDGDDPAQSPSDRATVPNAIVAMKNAIAKVAGDGSGEPDVLPVMSEDEEEENERMLYHVVVDIGAVANAHGC